MKNRYSLALGTALTAVLALTSLNTPLRAEDNPATLGNPGFDAATPTLEQVRAALMAPISKQPSTGDASPATTSGTGSQEPSGPGALNSANASAGPLPSGPIGSFGQTIPAKFSKRNDILDHVPTMALPLPLSDQQRKQIYDAVMAEKSEPVASADALKPSSELSPPQALNGMHPLPESVRGIDGVTRLYYVKAKGKVLLVEPATRTVVEQITS